MNPQTYAQGDASAAGAQKNKNVAKAPRHRPKHWFMIGRLQFGYHGVLGVICMILTGSVFFHLNPYCAMNVQIFLHLLCRDAFQMVDQSPAYTNIFGGIVVDHKPAFRLTIDVCHYCAVRVVVNCLQEILGPEHASTVFWVAFPIQVWRWWRLTPTQIYPIQHILTHRNPWFLLVPMGFGVTADMMQLLLGDDGVTRRMMLFTQLLCLIIAFLFTMAFRKYVPVAVLYVASVSIIWSIDSHLANLVYKDFRDFATEGNQEL
jgi:hypothetical protein